MRPRVACLLAETAVVVTAITMLQCIAESNNVTSQSYQNVSGCSQSCSVLRPGYRLVVQAVYQALHSGWLFCEACAATVVHGHAQSILIQICTMDM